MTDEIKLTLQEYLADAKAKLAALPARIESEQQAADEEGRYPFPIQPLTEVKPEVLRAALAAMKSPPEGAAEAAKVVRRVCCTQHEPFAMRSDHLLALLTAAGVTDGGL